MMTRLAELVALIIRRTNRTAYYLRVMRQAGGVPMHAYRSFLAYEARGMGDAIYRTVTR